MEDTQDQGLPSALRPRPGWDKSARNPEAIQSTINLSNVASTGYTDPSYQPPKLSPHSDAGEFDQSVFKEAQQGHKLSRTGSPTSTRGGGCGAGSADDAAAKELEGAPRADGRPAWDSRFHLERTAWEAQPRTMLLRPPSTNAFPGSGSTGVLSSLPAFNTGRGGGISGGGTFSDSGYSPGTRRVSGPVGLDGDGGYRSGGTLIGNTDGNGTRTTILPGLYAASPPMWASPYNEPLSPGASKTAASPAASPGLGGGAAGGTATAAAASPRPPHTDLAESYIGRAYSPDQAYFRRGTSNTGDSAPLPDGSGSSGSGGGRRRSVLGGAGASGGAADAPDEGGVDGHGTHLPSLERVYFRKPVAGADKDKEGQSGAHKAQQTARANAQRAAIEALGAVYMPGGKLRAAYGAEPRSARTGAAGAAGAGGSPQQLPLYMRSCRSTDADDGCRANGLDAGGGDGGGVGGGGGGAAEGGRDISPGGVWRPSGRQPIPEAAPPVPKNTCYKSMSGEIKETQEEADRRRAAPRDPAIYSPERYPIVGQGWFMPPEKFPPNPLYASVKPKYLEVRSPRADLDEEANKTPHMPDIHSKPWLNPGKHLVTDSSAPPPKLTGTAGARPPYSFSPSATGNSVAGTGTLRSNKGGTARSGRSGARGGGKGRKKRGDGTDSDSGSEIEGDRQVLAVIGGVRLCSIIKRDKMADEARLEAEEDAEMQEEERQAGAAAQGEQPDGEKDDVADEGEDKGEGEGGARTAASRERTSSAARGASSSGRPADGAADAAGDGSDLPAGRVSDLQQRDGEPSRQSSRASSSASSQSSRSSRKGSARGGSHPAEGGLGRAGGEAEDEEQEGAGYKAGQAAPVREASQEEEEAKQKQRQKEGQGREEEEGEEQEQEEGGQEEEEEEEDDLGAAAFVARDDDNDDDDDDEGLAAAAAGLGAGGAGDDEEAEAEEEAAEDEEAVKDGGNRD